MHTMSKAGALLLGAALASGLAGCKKHNEDVTPAPVTAPNTSPPQPAPRTTEPATATPPAGTATPDTAPAGGTTPGTGGTGGTSGTSGTQGTTGAGQPSSTEPDRIDHRGNQRDRRPTY